jgi:hypothetical protein
MTIHYLDIIAWFVGVLLIYIFAPDDFKEEIGILILAFILIVYTVIFVIVFGIIDLNVIDLLHKMHLTLSIEK